MIKKSVEIPKLLDRKISKIPKASAAFNGNYSAVVRAALMQYIEHEEQKRKMRVAS